MVQSASPTMPDSKAYINALADPSILDKIDKLFACGVGDLVDLPQLVVVGDQSSGKSSVLEGLTKLSFPRDSGLCTRFATQITFRRTEYPRVAASILAAANASAAHRQHLKCWSAPNLSSQGLDASNLGRIILEAQKHMGLSTTEEEIARKTFSDDVLHIDIEGPDEKHLSIVDVPGIFRNADDGRTTKEDIQMVEDMVVRYMKNPRTVMLVVVSANIDIATQGILQMAKQYDPKGLRTVGILTKPDLVDRGAEAKVIALVNNQRYTLRLGWHLVRNPGQAAMNDPSVDRDAEEKTFFDREHPWNTVSLKKRGIESLLLNIVDILARHVRSEFPKVRKDILARLGATEKRLKALGEERSTPGQQRRFLTNIASDFERLTQDALQTNYNDSLFDEKKLRLPTIIMARQDQYGEAMMLWGHEYAFERGLNPGDDVSDVDGRELTYTSEQSDDDEYVDEHGDEEESAESTQGDALSSEDGSGDEKDISHEENSRASEYADWTFPELAEFTIDKDTMVLTEPKDGIIPWLTNQHSSSRGFEVGGMDPAIVRTVFRGQACKWQALTKAYISDSIEAVHGFIKILLHSIVTDPRVYEVLTSHLLDKLLEMYRAASERAKFLLTVERERRLMTANHYFNDNLQKARKKRVRDDAVRLSFKYQAVGDEPTGDQPARKAVYLDNLCHSNPMSNRQHVIADLHDILKAYYKASVKRFVDGVIMQAVLNDLVDSDKSPLKLFSAKYVSRLTDEQLGDIAGEDPLIKAERDALKQEVDKLMLGRNIL